MTVSTGPNTVPSASNHAFICVCRASHLEHRGNGDGNVQLGVHTATCLCRTALQAYVIDVIHSLVEEQISPVLVCLATTGPQVRTSPPSCFGGGGARGGWEEALGKGGGGREQ